ncbi:MAG TPA: ATP-binding cassette domain-containing protein, partial [bacterium]|nr:ATP-binding cassette domain-containing protein [bacterium]
MSRTPAPEKPALVEVRGLRKSFPAGRTVWGRPRAWIRAVDGVDLAVPQGGTTGLVGESGSGKTTLGRLVLRLIPADAGEVLFEGEDLLRLAP